MDRRDARESLFDGPRSINGVGASQESGHAKVHVRSPWILDP